MGSVKLAIFTYIVVQELHRRGQRNFNLATKACPKLTQKENNRRGSETQLRHQRQTSATHHTVNPNLKKRPNPNSPNPNPYDSFVRAPDFVLCRDPEAAHLLLSLLFPPVFVFVSVSYVMAHFKK